jgi:hypothetical protein
MRTRILAAVMATALALALATPALAGLNQKANTLRAQVVKRFGAKTAGRDIIRLGVMTKHGVRPAPRAVKLSYVAVLDRALHPPPVRVPTSVPTSAPTSAGSSAGAAGLPACASESGTNYSMGPDNTNPSGASGRYQIMPFHWSTDCAGIAQDPAGQDKCATIIYRNSGASAWVGCGG